MRAAPGVREQGTANGWHRARPEIRRSPELPLPEPLFGASQPDPSRPAGRTPAGLPPNGSVRT